MSTPPATVHFNLRTIDNYFAHDSVSYTILYVGDRRKEWKGIRSEIYSEKLNKYKGFQEPFQNFPTIFQTLISRQTNLQIIIDDITAEES